MCLAALWRLPRAGVYRVVRSLAVAYAVFMQAIDEQQITLLLDVPDHHLSSLKSLHH
jgi:hypothetical protein